LSGSAYLHKRRQAGWPGNRSRFTRGFGLGARVSVKGSRSGPIELLTPSEPIPLTYPAKFFPVPLSFSSFRTLKMGKSGWPHPRRPPSWGFFPPWFPCPDSEIAEIRRISIRSSFFMASTIESEKDDLDSVSHILAGIHASEISGLSRLTLFLSWKHHLP